jgi:hypothetical protein
MVMDTTSAITKSAPNDRHLSPSRLLPAWTAAAEGPNAPNKPNPPITETLPHIYEKFMTSLSCPDYPHSMKR